MRCSRFKVGAYVMSREMNWFVLSDRIPWTSGLCDEYEHEFLKGSLNNLPSVSSWEINQDDAPGCAAIASEDILPEKDLKSGPDAQIKNTIIPGELQELKRPLDALTDRCKALEVAVPKLA